ncbi:hypothetical protein Zmor_022469 [Zophobas morio]|uniref:Uncharacterized protein n=1 Tax=Zophobas morio TaxID=2755281 RepID=A0AA38HWN6_9CUCU|nr:hypothetical protein Zmor_022469 [Zophobas morio]
MNDPWKKKYERTEEIQEDLGERDLGKESERSVERATRKKIERLGNERENSFPILFLCPKEREIWGTIEDRAGKRKKDTWRERGI